jgi:head-tail adaptor
MIGYNKSEIVGKMRERVVLQNRTISQSDSGFQSETFTNISTYGHLLIIKLALRKKTLIRLLGQQKILFTIRYNTNVTIKSRFLYRSDLFQIERIEVSNDRRFMDCLGTFRTSY